MQTNIITSTKSNIINKRVLFVPDSIWGELSGHRSSKYLVKAFNKIGLKVGVYAPKENYTLEQGEALINYATYFEQTPYRYFQNLRPSLIEKEFLSVLEEFKPDIVFYMGVIKNKASIDICLKYGVAYSYLPLTTEYYCVKDFAALEDGPCFQCIKKPILSPIKNKCLGSRFNIANYAKNILLTKYSKSRITNATKVAGYSDNQLSVLNEFGVDNDATIKLPVFFDKDTIRGTKSNVGDYFVMAGQNITAKGWHIIPKVIKKTKNIKFKLIMRSKEDAKKYIKKYELQDFIDNGLVEMKTYLKTHKEILEVMANSRGVLVPSYYASTGEFYMIEALGLGKPVILFDVGIHGEIINHEINGMISTVGDIKDFCKNIEKVNESDDLYKKLSQGSANLFNKLLSMDNFKQNIENYFR